MTDRRLQSLHELLNIADSLARETLEATDAEITEEIRLRGEDPNKVSQNITRIIQSAIKLHGQQQLMKARVGYQETLTEMKNKVYSLPKTAKERLQLLLSTVSSRPELKEMLTVQHRSFEEITDEDVSSYLEQLQELGVLDPSKEPE